jgi:hypothetical protein
MMPMSHNELAAPTAAPARSPPTRLKVSATTAGNISPTPAPVVAVPTKAAAGVWAVATTISPPASTQRFPMVSVLRRRRSATGLPASLANKNAAAKTVSPIEDPAPIE